MASKIAIANSQTVKPKKEKEKQEFADETMAFLQKLFPNKINFSIDEAANVLNLSYDFVRDHIKSDQINAIKFGDRWMINLFELARLIMEGIHGNN
ncbi:MAG: helix-turn-helix domain-containing protein [Melioribacteraceae bacterium]